MDSFSTDRLPARPKRGGHENCLYPAGADKPDICPSVLNEPLFNLNTRQLQPQTESGHNDTVITIHAE